MSAANPNTVILFTRYPTPGQTKTRLISMLGAEGAARLQREMTELIVTRLKPAVVLGRFQLTICYSGASSRAMRRWMGNGFTYEPQSGGDLGERMIRAIQSRFDQGACKVLVIGADCPGVDLPIVEKAFAALDHNPVVFGPAHDGGYYLVGLNQPCRELFQGITWGEATVLAESVKLARQLGFHPVLLPPLADIDRPDDLPHWEAVRRASSTVAVIIPTLNEAPNLGETLARVAREQPDEIIVADGGSTDGTRDVARQMGARVLEAPRGRAPQMNAGAAVASSELLLFLHADTWPPEGYVDVIRGHLNHPAVAAGAFRFALRERFRGRSVIQRLVWARCRCFGTPFGDQGLFIRRDLFQAIGGFSEWPLLEDVDLVRRLRRHGQIAHANAPIQTSSRRWQERGVWRIFFTNQFVLLGYYSGISPERLARFYFNVGKSHLDSRSDVRAGLLSHRADRTSRQ